MYTLKKRISALLAVALLIFATVFILSACKDDKPIVETKEYKVQFKVDNEVYKDVTSENGKIKLPEPPTKEGFNFKGWYFDRSFTKPLNVDDFKAFKDTVVYAQFIEEVFDLYIAGQDEKFAENISKLDLYKHLPPEKPGLTLKAWYIDNLCTEPYEGQNLGGVNKLYATYQAKVVFNNGYEDCLETYYDVGIPLQFPTVEQITKDKKYMDKENIRFELDGQILQEDNFVINGNTTINVLWQSPYLELQKQKNTGNYSFSGFESKYELVSIIKALPVISIPSETIYKGEKVKINTCASKYGNYANPSVIIFQEGIKYILYMTTKGNSNLKEIKFPKSTKVIEGSFNDVTNLKKVTLPENVEVIQNSFRAAKGNTMDKIKLPKSVEYLVDIPDVFDISDNPLFTMDKDGTRMLKIDGNEKILIADFTPTIDGNIVVPNHITSIQVKTYGQSTDINGIKYKSILLPESLKKVTYKPSNEKYPDYDTEEYYLSAIRSYPIDNLDNLFNSNEFMKKTDFSFIDIRELEYVGFDTYEIPTEIKGYNMVGYSAETTSYRTFTDPIFNHKVYCLKEKAEGDPIEVRVRAYNEITEKETAYNIAGKVSGDIITIADIEQATGISTQYYTFNNFYETGKEYEAQPLTRNIYITIDYKFTKGGYVVEKADPSAADSDLIIIGYDQSSALEIDGGTLVVIPAVEDGHKIIGIKESAFYNNQSIKEIFIGENIKYIGDNAFKGAVNITKVIIESTTLEVIGERAFEQVGESMDMKKNKDGIRIEIPLAQLKDIKPYAFNSEAIVYFQNVKAEKDRQLTEVDTSIPGQATYHILAKVGEFYIWQRNEIIKITKISEEYITRGEKVKAKVIDADLYSRARDVNTNYVTLGDTWIRYMPTGIVIRLFLKEGSVVAPQKPVNFMLVSGAEKNAITKVDPKYLETTQRKDPLTGANVTRYKDGFRIYNLTPDTASSYHRIKDEQWTLKKDFSDKSKFAEGWIDFDTSDPITLNAEYMEYSNSDY